MAKLRSTRHARPRTHAAISVGYVEMAPAPKRAVAGDTGQYVVCLADGERVTARPGAGVAPSFLRECLRERRMVVVVPGREGAVIAGALQTRSHPSTDERGTLALDAEHVRLDARRSLTLEVPGGRLALEKGGAVRLDGDRLVIDAAAFVRFLSARVELP
jgi:hypothetical protein